MEKGNIVLIEEFINKNIDNKDNISWDFLFEVIEKIEKLDLSEYHYEWDCCGKMENNFICIMFDISTDSVVVYEDLQLDPETMIYSDNLYSSNLSKKESVIEAIIQTIKWYNNLLKHFKK